MAEDKNSFILYRDNKELWEELTNEQAGNLIKHIYRYINDENPEAPDTLTGLLFIPIKQSFKRDLKKYNKSKEDKSQAGAIGNLKRWNEDLYKKYRKKEMTLKEAQNIADARKVSQCDKNVADVAVSVSDSVSDIYIYSEKEFLEDWTKCRKAYLKLPTHISKLEIFEALNFSKATNIFTREQIQSAMKGLFMQEVISFSSMITKPNHFLERVEQYYMAYESKDFKQYGSKKAQE